MSTHPSLNLPKYSSKLIHAFLEHNEHQFSKYSSKLHKALLSQKANSGNLPSSQKQQKMHSGFKAVGSHDQNVPAIQNKDNIITLTRCDLCNFSEKKRTLWESDYFLVVCPTKCRIPFRHFSIHPKSHLMSFCQLDKNEYSELQEIKNSIQSYFNSSKTRVFFVEVSFDFKKLDHCFCEVFLIDFLDDKTLEFSIESFLGTLVEEKLTYQQISSQNCH